MKWTKRYLSNIWRFIRLFFHFRKPAFENLEVCNLLVEQKPIFLIGWKSPYRYSVHIKAANFNSYRRNGIHLLKMTAPFNEVAIVLRSGWRKRCYKIPVYSMAIPPEVLVEILSKPGRLRMPDVKKFQLSTAIMFDIITPQIASGISPIQTNFSPVDIKSFHYEQP